MAISWQLYHAHAQINLQYDWKKNLVYVQWGGHIVADDIISAANAYLRLQERWKCPSILNDNRNVTGDWAEANDWLQYEWLPQAVSSGLTCMAMLIPYEFEQIVASNNLLKRFSGSCQTKVFWDKLQAESWLSNCSNERGSTFIESNK